MTVYCSAPFLGPTWVPIAGSFLGEYAGWKWVDGLTVAFSGVMWIVGMLIVPETCSPRLLIGGAAKLSQMTGRVYRSKLEIEKGPKKAKAIFKIAMTRPWILLVREPIVLLLSIYMAIGSYPFTGNKPVLILSISNRRHIVYGTLYLIFSAFLIVLETQRGWSQGVNGLSFIGNILGQIAALILYSVFFDVRYRRHLVKAGGFLPPEARLTPAVAGCVLLPAGLIWFAWTTYPSIHWIVLLRGSTLSGFGQVLVFLSVMNHLIDAYTIYAASTLAANAVLRALFAAALSATAHLSRHHATSPIFTPYMYRSLGAQWASSVPAFIALTCTPFPFL